MAKYYRLFSAGGKALTNYTKRRSDVNAAKKFYQKFKHYKRMKVKVYSSRQKP